MLAKPTAKNQPPLPEAAVQVADATAAAGEDGPTISTPRRTGRADAVRRKLEDLGLTEADVAVAVAWVRR